MKVVNLAIMVKMANSSKLPATCTGNQMQIGCIQHNGSIVRGVDAATLCTDKETYTTVVQVFAAKPCGTPATATLPEFGTEVSHPFQYMGVEFAGPLKYKGNKREEKAYVLMFTCATCRVVHLVLTRAQSPEELQKKLNVS